MSAISNALNEFQADIPPEVLAIMEAKGLSTQVAASNRHWMDVKVRMLSWYCQRLRTQLTTVTEAKEAVEVELLQIQVRYLAEMRDRDKFISEVRAWRWGRWGRWGLVRASFRGARAAGGGRGQVANSSVEGQVDTQGGDG